MSDTNDASPNSLTTPVDPLNPEGLDESELKLLEDIAESILKGRLTLKMIVKKLVPPKTPKKKTTSESQQKQKEYLRKWRENHPDYYKTYHKQHKEASSVKYYASKIL
jgi:hypothetical protein